jgi:hypothetical protein
MISAITSAPPVSPSARDPSSGNVGNENLVRVATVHDPREAIPLSGSWIGQRSDHLAMKVFVKVAATAP